MPQQQQIITFQGGLDLVTPPLQMPPGRCILAENYEAEARGYRRLAGYERYDGQPAPSGTTTVELGFDTGTTEPSLGDKVTGATSSAYGWLVEAATVTSGTWVGNDAAGTMILRNVSGSFQDNENLQVSASTFALCDGTNNPSWAGNDTTAETYRQTAVEQARSEIAAVTGSGAIRGVCTYAGNVYAFRDNAGGTACIMHKATAAGWEAQTFGSTLNFDAGTAAFTTGLTVTGGTSAATATIERVIVMSGTWAGNDAAGYLVLSSVSGTFQNNETITDSSTGSATADGADDDIALPAGGTYRCVENNFYGLSYQSRLYGVNGVGYAFEWDGSVLAPIQTGAGGTVDKPKFIGVLSNHLFLGYSGGSLQYSGTGLPLSFLANDGAGEIGFGQDLTGLRGGVRGSLIITARNRIGYLTGTATASFQMDIISEDSGAIADTLEVIGSPHFLDDQGVRSLQTAQEFGNWNIGTVTKLIEPLITAKKEGGIAVVGAARVREKDQYRLFYGDGTGVTIYFGREQPEAMPFRLGFTPAVIHSGQDASGDEMLLAGASDGFVYHLDSGQSLDGTEMDCFVRLPFVHQGRPNQIKRYHRALVEVEAGAFSNSLSLSAMFAYGNDEAPIGVGTTFDAYGIPGIWDIAQWDLFSWDGPERDKSYVPLDGIGENISLQFESTSTYEDPHTLSAVTINYSPRRQLR